MKNLSKESLFIVGCMRSSLTGAPIDRELFDVVDFEKVYRVAVSHSVMGLVFNAVKPFREYMPKDVFEKMSGVNKMMIMSSVARNGSIDEVSKTLSQNGFRFILLKGAVIQNLYPEKYMRYSTDTDVLVEEKDYEKTCPLLKELSYKFDSQNDKHYVFWKKPYVCVEIHKKLVSENAFFDSVWDNVFDEDGKLAIKREFELTYLLYHMAENFSKTAGIGLHSIADVYLYLKKYNECLDKTLLEKYLDEVGLLKFFEAVKTLGETLFDEKNTDDFFADLAEYIIASGRSGDAVKAASGNISSDRPLALGKIKFFLSKLFLPYNDLKKIYPALGKAPLLLPVFWGMRICGIVFRPEHQGFNRAKTIIKNADRQSIEKSKEILRHLGIENRKL